MSDVNMEQMPDLGRFVDYVWNLKAERDQLRAELEAIRGQQVVGRVHHNEEHAEPVRAVLNSIGRQLPNNAPLYAIPPQQPDTWPTLDKPAKVGPVRFNPGLSARLVVEAAQRQHEYSQQPEVEAERLERFKRAMREFRGEQHDAVSVPSDTALRRAAKFLAGIDNGCNEVKTLRALVEDAQGIGAVSVPRELLERLLDSNNRNTFCAGTYLKAHDELSAILSTKNAEEGDDGRTAD